MLWSQMYMLWPFTYHGYKTEVTLSGSIFKKLRQEEPDRRQEAGGVMLAVLAVVRTNMYLEGDRDRYKNNGIVRNATAVLLPSYVSSTWYVCWVMNGNRRYLGMMVAILIRYKMERS